MTLHAKNSGRPAIALTALAAAGGLILTGCHSSSSASAVGTTQPASTPASGGASGSAAAVSSAGSSSAIVSSGSLPFPTTPGDTWVYSNTDGATSETKVVSVTQVPSGQQVLMDNSLKLNGVTQSSHYSYIVEPNGQIVLPFSQFNTGAAGVSVKLVSGGMYWPSAAELASGQAYHSTLTMEFTIAGKTEQVATHITATGEGTQSVTVPAGTYSATVVSELEAEKFDGVNVSTDIKTWLAPGVGPVESEIISVDGSTQNITNKEELISFAKG
jgi:hypothetical protein